MRRITLVVAILALVSASCGAGGVAGTSTTDGTLPSTSTTVDAQETTTTTPATTTTTGLISTTTSGATTTIAPVEGDWAEKPLVTSSSFYPALGWWEDGEWVAVSEATKLPFEAGDDFQIAHLGSVAKVLSGQPTEACAIGPTGRPGVELSDERAPTVEIGGLAFDTVAISAPWELVPHDVESISDDGTYAQFAAQLLRERGFSDVDPVVKQLISVDLEGDGIDEALVVAEETELLPESSGVYSLVFVRRIGTSGDLETHVLEESVIRRDDTGFPESYAITAVADLNGDRTMEIVVAGMAWENSWVTVYEMSRNMDAPVSALSAGCGV